MRLLPSVLKARSIAKRLIRSKARKSVYIPKGRQEELGGPYTRLLGLENDYEQRALEEWQDHLQGWDLSRPPERKQLVEIILSAAEDALSDARRSLESDDPETTQLLDEFKARFDADLLLRPPVGEA